MHAFCRTYLPDWPNHRPWIWGSQSCKVGALRYEYSQVKRGRARRVPNAIVCYDRHRHSRASGDAQAEAKSEISMSRLTFPGCASGPKVLCTNAIDIPLSWGSRSSTRRSQAIRPSSLRATTKACGSPDPPRQSVLRRRRVRTSGRMPSPPRPPAAPIN